MQVHPRFLDAFATAGVMNLASADARALLAIAPTPAAGATLTCARIACALRRGGRQRNIDRLADKLRHALRRRQLHQPALVEQALMRASGLAIRQTRAKPLAGEHCMALDRESC